MTAGYNFWYRRRLPRYELMLFSDNFRSRRWERNSSKSDDIFINSLLPVHDLIDDDLLFGAAAVQIDAGGFNTLMAQKIREKRDIAACLNKIFGKPMAEGVGVEDSRIQAALGWPPESQAVPAGLKREGRGAALLWQAI